MLALVALAREAGVAIEAVRTRGFEALAKGDGSPVTEADMAADAILCDGLRLLFPGIPIVSEERAADPLASADMRFILVDPVDGTKEFVAGRPEYTVNIALIENRRPVAGVVLAPATGEVFVGDLQPGTAGAWRGGADGALAPMRARVRPASLVAVASRSHGDARTEAYLNGFAVARRIAIGSSLKFCLVASGQADLYPRFAPTCEWDTAAGDAVATAAGASVTCPDGSPFLYGKQEAAFLNGNFVVSGPLA